MRLALGHASGCVWMCGGTLRVMLSGSAFNYELVERYKGQLPLFAIQSESSAGIAGSVEDFVNF